MKNTQKYMQNNVSISKKFYKREAINNEKRLNYKKTWEMRLTIKKKKRGLGI